ncbi:hypothetical protein MMC14_000747 [Varicellaria rhodocarpa]|nr:hypothetical protein [Varicellaria rhodocarpa]
MASSHSPRDTEEPLQDEEAMLDPNEAAEEIPSDPDQPMDSDPEDDDAEEQEIRLQNDSVAHFDHHTDSIFCITQHPLDPSTIATGSGDDVAFVFSSQTPAPLLPPSYESNPQPSRQSLAPIAKLSGHTDSVNAITFTLPHGTYLCTAGLDGRLRIYNTPPLSSLADPSYSFLAESQEVPEINFLIPCPHLSYPNTIALGASDGSVWVYSIDATDKTSALQIQQSYFLHTASCTAGAWTPDGKLLATVSEDGSLYVWDPFGEATASGVTSQSGGQAVVSLTAEDQRFEVEGGLFSIAIAPSSAFVVVGGANGMIRVVGLPILPSSSPYASTTQATKSQKGSGAKSKPGGSKKAPSSHIDSAASGQAGQILASLQTQSDGIETLSFSSPPLTLLAAGSVDGSIALFDYAHRFAARRHIRDAHEEFAVVKLEFTKPDPAATIAPTPQQRTPLPQGQVLQDHQAWMLTSCGMDGVVRKWDTRGGTTASGMGLVGEWRGHRGEGEGGGVLGFVQSGKGSQARIVTAGDDGVSLVFATEGQ